MPAKPNSATFQFGPQLSEIIDFTVERNCILAVGRDHWLMSHWGQVDNCEAALPEGNAGFLAQPNSTVVWSAVTQGLRHCRCTPFQILQAATITLPDTGNSAHAWKALPNERASTDGHPS